MEAQALLQVTAGEVHCTACSTSHCDFRYAKLALTHLGAKHADVRFVLGQICAVNTHLHQDIQVSVSHR